MEAGMPRVNLPASLVGKYELTRELAVGGMGIIWLARDKKENRDVVFKFIAPELIGDEETRIRFLNEAKLTAQLEHPHIVQLYAAGEEEGAMYIIYEYLDGTNLKTLLEKYGAYRIGQALDILIKVSDGIACAHRHKILHRDIKPENILVSPLGDKVKVVDFGIAKSIEDSQKLTQTGFIIGTPEYLSPEQAVGHKATYASDQYALAVLAYEMLTARLPIEDTNTVDLFTKKIRGGWVPIRDRRPEIPPELAKIIEKAMATDAAQRYLTVDDFVKALTGFASRRSTVGMTRPGAQTKGGPGAGPAIRVGTAPSPTPRGGTPRVSTGSTAVHKATSGSGVVGKVLGGLAAVAAVAAVAFGIHTFWPARTNEGPLPRMFGQLVTQHQPDGVHLAWDLPASGSAFVRLNPSGVEKPMASEKGRLRAHIAPEEGKGTTTLDLYMKDGATVTTEVKGVPFVSVVASGDALTVYVPPVPDSAPVLACWPAGKDAKRSELPLKARGRGFVAESVPMAAGEDLLLQVVSSAAEKQPLSFVQKVPSLGAFLESLEADLGKVDATAILTGQGPDALKGAVAKAFDQLKAAVPSASIDTARDMVGSAAVETSRKLSLFEKVQRLQLLAVMGKRAGWTGRSAEVEALVDLPWPVQVKMNVDKRLPGQRKKSDKPREQLMAIPNFNQLSCAVPDPESAKQAVLELNFMSFGTGTFLKVAVNNRATFYLWGPDEHPGNVSVQQVSMRVELAPPALVKGANEIVIEGQPVLALVSHESELLLVGQKLTVVGAAGPTPVPLTKK